YMGEEKFNRAIQRYAREFRFGNAALKDLIRICSQESAQDLEWFFQQWLLSKKTCDFAVREVSLDKIILENRGSVVMPVQARVFYQDNTESNFCWDGKSTTYTIEVPSGKKVQRVELDPDNSITLDIDRTNNQWPRNFKIKPVPLYFLAYEVPLFLPRDSCTQVIGPSIGGSSLGVTTSLQKPYDHILRLNSGYDFNAREVKMALGYEVSHIFNQQLAAGFEIFDYESSKQKHDLSGGKLYLRKELWPASYGVFSANDHVTLYLTRDKKIDNSGLNGKEEVQGLHYLKKDEAIVGITGSLGRYGPYADPSFGWKFISTQEFAGHFLGGNQAFWRTSAELDNYYLLFPKRQHKLANRMRLGWGEHSDKNLFELGGIDALRGYSRKDIQGAHAFLETIEYRMPLLSEAKVYFLDNIFCLDGIQAVAFFDVGKAWYSSFAESDFKKDVGFGLRFHFNILSFLEKAVVRFDVARPINDEANKDTHYWLSFSQSF
ncbi:MAG: BamA/TamA family outer membrane protein, partial [Candidatus Omnitrophica bacterium]|nr:BamA/TamA family outer membrane protein [Candidatus Omnitrophota bacterium]